MLEVRRDTPTANALAGGGMLVTPDGTWVHEESSDFFIALGDTDPDYDASLFAVKNLGFIAVRIESKSLVDIMLHPRNVASTALLSLQHRLPSIQSEMFRISYLKDVWLSETTSLSTRAICRLSEICALEGVVGVTLEAPRL